MNLVGKKIIVTGGANGIGASVVKNYCLAGAKVVSFDYDEQNGKKVVEDINSKVENKALFLKADISDKTQVDNAFEKAVEFLGGLDVLAHVAGVHRAIPAETTSQSDIDFIANININGTVWTNQAAFRFMKEKGGVIINYGSISGLRPEVGSALYSLTKGAVHSWTRTVAHEWGKYNIRVNAILPIISTPMYEASINAMTEEQLESFKNNTLNNIPIGQRYGNADEDLAPVMNFFASDDSRFITGQLIPVDGGLASIR
jgi:3-oxoacyl-[acyl-carrier protein] reductase